MKESASKVYAMLTCGSTLTTDALHSYAAAGILARDGYTALDIIHFL